MRPLNFDQDEITAENRLLDLHTHTTVTDTFYRCASSHHFVWPIQWIISSNLFFTYLHKHEWQLVSDLCFLRFSNAVLSGPFRSFHTLVSEKFSSVVHLSAFSFPFQSSDMGHGEVWLVLTDPSLQEEKPERMCKRTVALCVNTSCVLTSSVLSALNSSSVCCMSFRDAIRENGRASLRKRCYPTKLCTSPKV